MPQRETSARRTARREAQRVRAAREHAHARREEQIEAALTDYFAATARIDRRLEAAGRRASRIMQSAEESAAQDRIAAREAVKRLHALVAVAEIAELCGLSQRAVRDMLADGRAAETDEPAQQISGDEEGTSRSSLSAPPDSGYGGDDHGRQ